MSSCFLHLTEFTEALTNAQTASNTLRAYTSDLCAFAKWFSETNGVAPQDETITAADLREYRQFLLTRGAKVATINRRFAALRRYLAWAAEARLIETAPKTPKTLRRAREAPKSLDKSAEYALIRAVERRGKLRDVALVTLLLGTGIRVGELVELRVDDITLSPRGGVLRVRRSKGDRAREVPLSVEVRRSLRAYLEQRLICDHDKVFVGRGGVPLGSRGVQDLVRRYAYDARIERVTPHRLRHTVLSKLIRGGTDLVCVADIAGHSNLATLMTYTRPSLQDKVRAMDSIA